MLLVLLLALVMQIQQLLDILKRIYSYLYMGGHTCKRDWHEVRALTDGFCTRFNRVGHQTNIYHIPYIPPVDAIVIFILKLREASAFLLYPLRKHRRRDY